MLSFLLFTQVSSLVLPLTETRALKLVKKYDPLSKHSLASSMIENNFNLQYSTTLGFGTPSQNMTLTLDTGSSYTWIPSTECYCHESLNSFDQNLSSSYKNLSKPITLQYGIGTVEGMLSSETVTLDTLEAVNQTIVLSSYDFELDSLASDGLLGLGMKELSDGYLTFVETLKEQKKINSSVFSFYINNKDNNVMDSVFTVGEYDLKKYGNGEYETIGITPLYGFWLTSLEGFKYGNKRLNRKQSWAILDLGSSLISMPNVMYRKYYSEVNKKIKGCFDMGYVVCNCTFGDYTLFPDVGLTIDGNDFTIHAENYIYYENGYCYLLLEGGDQDLWILGQPFFREFYTVFDIDNLQVLASPAFRDGRIFNIFPVNSAFVALGVAGIALLWKWGYRREENDYTRII
jgi:hypothetical protein